MITCNYDGVTKTETIIENGVFVGSNSTLVAPLKLGNGAYIAAGFLHHGGRPGRCIGVGTLETDD